MAEDRKTTGWEEEDAFWTSNYPTRPYATSARDYQSYRPAYRFGYDAANRYHGREWDDVEPDLSRSWNSYEDRGKSTWEQVKDAVRDAWDRVTGKHHVGAR